MANLLTHTGARFEWLGDYYTRSAPKEAGFRFDPAAKRWWTADAALARALAAEADAPARAALGALDARIAESRAAAADVVVPAPAGRAYLPFQVAGIRYATGRAGVLFGDDMGLGKTIQVLGVLNAEPALRRVLIACPASLMRNWRREAERWLVEPRRIVLMEGGVVPPRAEADIVIASFDACWNAAAALRAEPWDAVVCDEAHLLRNAGANRTRAVFGGKATKAAIKGKAARAQAKVKPDGKARPSPAEVRAARAAAEAKALAADPGPLTPLDTPRWILATGTPIPNRPIELWPLLQKLDPAGLGASWFRFVTRYCDGHRGQWGWEVKGATNLEELQDRLRGAFMVRRRKADVLTELPAKRRQVIVLDGAEADEALAAEREAWAAREDRLVTLQARADVAQASDDPADYRRAVEALEAAVATAFTEIANLRAATAVRKVPHVIEHVREAVEGSGKVVLFAHHHSVIDAAAEALADLGVVTLTGDTLLPARQAAVDRFQMDPACRVFIGSIQAAGVGLTLTAAHHVVFAELDWVPGNMTQAEDRCHRIGQRDSVLVQHLVFDGSLDARMAEILVAKQDVMDRALDLVGGRPAVEIPATPLRGGSSARREALDAVAATLTPAQMHAIAAGLHRLAAACDGAQTWDGHGFSKLDARIGKELAERETLTPRQAALGRKILARYRRTQVADLAAIIWPTEAAGDEAA